MMSSADDRQDVLVFEPERSLFWDFHDLADRLSQTLQDAENAMRQEQAVFGLDSLADLRMHQLLVRGLSRGCTAQREVHAPTVKPRRKNIRGFADLVLTPLGRPLRYSDEPDLFTPADACPAEEALWLTVRTHRQYPPPASGSAGAAASPGAWRPTLAVDLLKLIGDPRIRETGLLLLAFTDSHESLALTVQSIDHDLVRAGILPVSAAAHRHTRTLSITDRHGHRLASVVLWSLTPRLVEPRG